MYKHTEKCINIHTISGFPVDLSENSDNLLLRIWRTLTVLIFPVRSGELYIQFNKLSENSGSPSFTPIIYYIREKTIRPYDKKPCFIPYIRRNTTRHKIAIFGQNLANIWEVIHSEKRIMKSSKETRQAHTGGKVGTI